MAKPSQAKKNLYQHGKKTHLHILVKLWGVIWRMNSMGQLKVVVLCWNVFHPVSQHSKFSKGAMIDQLPARGFPHTLPVGVPGKQNQKCWEGEGGTQEESNTRLPAGFTATNHLHTCVAVAVRRCKLLHKVQGISQPCPSCLISSC